MKTIKKTMYFAYDCQECGKRHLLKGDWIEETEVELRAEHGLEITTEIKTKAKEEMERMFYELHPEATTEYNPDLFLEIKLSQDTVEIGKRE